MHYSLAFFDFRTEILKYSVKYMDKQNSRSEVLPNIGKNRTRTCYLFLSRVNIFLIQFYLDIQEINMRKRIHKKGIIWDN